jgi:MoxR-vWA-beta-propeller ternary system domain bpX4
MTPFEEFLAQLLDRGRIIFRSTTAPRDRPSAHAVSLLARAFQTHALSVAGPAITFDPQVACAAAELLRQASWASVNHDDRVDELQKRLKLPGSPQTPSHHLSADLTLRYLPQILRRARALDPSDPLVAILARVLRGWPLSGVLSDVDEGPLTSLDFGGHRGLLLLYAERLLTSDRPSWRPMPAGPGWEHDEWVRQEQSRVAEAKPFVAASP